MADLDNGKSLITREGAEKLKAELEELKLVKRKEITERIKEAREQGDLSENAEYDAARDDQRDNEARIEEIEKILKNVTIVEDSESDGKTVNLGTSVTILDDGEEIVYHIVGSNETNSLEGKISNESPIGRALMGAKKGDIVEVDAPMGSFCIKVLNVEKTR